MARISFCSVSYVREERGSKRKIGRCISTTRKVSEIHGKKRVSAKPMAEQRRLCVLSNSHIPLVSRSVLSPCHLEEFAESWCSKCAAHAAPVDDTSKTDDAGLA